MRRTEWLQETRMLRFEEAFSGWTEKRLKQEEAARLLGVCERTFRRYVARYEELGLDGLVDKRLTQSSHRKAPVDEVLALVEWYRKRHKGWRARHFHAWYKRDGGKRSYTFVKLRLHGEWKETQGYWSDRAREKGLLKEGDLNRFLRRL